MITLLRREVVGVFVPFSCAASARKNHGLAVQKKKLNGAEPSFALTDTLQRTQSCFGMIEQLAVQRGALFYWSIVIGQH
jgi:hypothetical protein